MKLQKTVFIQSKSFIKKSLLSDLGKNVKVSRLSYNSGSKEWDIDLVLSYEIPKGSELVREGFEEDFRSQDIQTSLSKEEELLKAQIETTVGEVADSLKRIDGTLTYIFPPFFIARKKGEFYQLMTDDERATIETDFPSLKNMINADFRLLNEGYYEFIPGTSIEEEEICAFKLKKYSTLRVWYSFSIPHEFVSRRMGNPMKTSVKKECL